MQSKPSRMVISGLVETLKGVTQKIIGCSKVNLRLNKSRASEQESMIIWAALLGLLIFWVSSLKPSTGSLLAKPGLGFET